jgi:hypothetical protein
MSSSKKILIVSLLMFIIGFQILNKTGFLLYFALNRPAIVEKHCVNKAVKTMKCDGKCHLKKYVKSELKQTQQAPDREDVPSFPNLKELKNFNFYYIADQVCSWDAPTTQIIRLSIDQQSSTAFFYQEHKGRKHSGALFHPPLV